MVLWPEAKVDTKGMWPQTPKEVWQKIISLATRIQKAIPDSRQNKKIMGPRMMLRGFGGVSPFVDQQRCNQVGFVHLKSFPSVCAVLLNRRSKLGEGPN